MRTDWQAIREKVLDVYEALPAGAKAWSADSPNWTPGGWRSPYRGGLDLERDGLWNAIVLVYQPDPTAAAIFDARHTYLCSVGMTLDDELSVLLPKHREHCRHCGQPDVMYDWDEGDAFSRVAAVMLGHPDAGDWFMGFACGLDDNDTRTRIKESFGLAGLAGQAAAFALRPTPWEFYCEACYKHFRSATSRDEHVAAHRADIDAAVAAGKHDRDLWWLWTRFYRASGIDDFAEQPALAVVRQRFPSASWREIGEAMGVAASTVSSQLRGRDYPSDKLRAAFAAMFPDSDAAFRLQPQPRVPADIAA